MKREHQESSYGDGGGGGGGGGGGSGYAGDIYMGGKGKRTMTEEAKSKEEEEMDELLATLGYKVRSSDMADVAQKLEQLDMAMAMGSCAAPDDGFLLSQLHLPPSDLVHYNPSDLSSWLDSMISELNAPPPPLPPSPPPPPPAAAAAAAEPVLTSAEHHRQCFDLPSGSNAAESDLKPIPAPAVDPAVFGSDPCSEVTRDRKRMRVGASAAASSSSSSSSSPSPSSASSLGSGGRGAEAVPVPVPVPVVVVDSQEAGIRLVHALMACAEAVQRESLAAADALLKEISVLAASQGGAMRKVAAYFAEALAHRVYSLRPPRPDPSLFADLLYAHFYEASPCLKFAHFTANQAILEAFAGCRRVHVVDLGVRQGLQWPALLQALALRPGGAPSFRLSAVGPPASADALREVGWKLARFADAVRVDFRYRSVVAASLADLDPYTLRKPRSSASAAAAEAEEGEEEEAVAVNAVMELHQVLAQPGAAEKVLGTVRALRPRVFTVVEQEANHNAGSFRERFTEALHYYSTVFDSLEGCGAGETGASERVMAEAYVGREIANVVGCEGAERTERHETLAQWRGRMARAGFAPVPIGSDAFKQASTLLALFSGAGGAGGFRVEEREGCLTLGWHTRPLIATSAWCAAAAAPAPAPAP